MMSKPRSLVSLLKSTLKWLGLPHKNPDFQLLWKGWQCPAAFAVEQVMGLCSGVVF